MLLLRERYRAIQAIGQGGFGRTFLAMDEDKPSKPRCVIKQFCPRNQGIHDIQKAAELFFQEAIRLDELGKHPQIPELLAHFTQSDRQYLIQEFIDGQNLAQELARNGVFNEVQILTLLNDLLPVLDFVHNQQVIHRDIKPENIIRRSSDRKFVLVDFGAAKYASSAALLRTGTTIGSPEYLAPEQARGKAVFASDIYSLGATCVYLMTQVSPFDLFDSSEGTWIWRSYLKSPVSHSLGGILDKMLEFATNRRYQSADEVIQALNSSVLGSHPEPIDDSPPSVASHPHPEPVDHPALTMASNLQPDPNSNPTFIYDSPASVQGESLASERGVDYTRLRDLLSDQKWKEADAETADKILEVMGQLQEGYLIEEDITNFPCRDLRTINQLWVHYSNGRFGFSVQKRIWIEEGGKPGVYDHQVYERFGTQVGWRVNNQWKYYADLNFSLNAPFGHLPIFLPISFSFRDDELIDTLFSRIQACQL